MNVLKKGDIFIIGTVGIIFVLSIIFLVLFAIQGNSVVIKQNNKIVYDKSIDINDTIDIGTNTIVIKDGIVYMKDANCKNQVCVNTGEISKKGESIVCLPNKVIVEIK